MKTIITLLLSIPFLVSIAANGMEPLPGFANHRTSFTDETNTLVRSELMLNAFSKKKTPETGFSNVKKTFSGLTNFYLGKNIKLKIITPGPFAKIKVARGIYPECFPARFSVKINYTF